MSDAAKKTRFSKILRLGLFFIGLITAFVIFSGFALFDWKNPFKVINPDDPRFNPYHFAFEDHLPSNVLENDMPKILKVGMTMKEVDKILMTAGGATKAKPGATQHAGSIGYTYQYYPWTYWFKSIVMFYPFNPISIAVLFDESGRLIRIKIASS